LEYQKPLPFVGPSFIAATLAQRQTHFISLQWWLKSVSLLTATLTDANYFWVRAVSFAAFLNGESHPPPPARTTTTQPTPILFSGRRDDNLKKRRSLSLVRASICYKIHLGTTFGAPV